MPYTFNPLTGTFDYYATSAGGNSFGVVQTPAGTSPTAVRGNDALTLTSSDGSVTITGNSTTDTIDFKGASSKSSFRPPVAAVDTTSFTTLPTGASTTVDGYSVQNGDRILFAHLSSNNGRIYTASGIGTSVSWTLATDGQAGTGVPTNGDTVWSVGGNYNSIGRWTYNNGWTSNLNLGGINLSTASANNIISSNARPVFVSNGTSTKLVSGGGGNQAAFYLFDDHIIIGADNAAIVPHFTCSPDNYADLGTADGGTTLKRFRDIYAARDVYHGNGIKIKEGTNQRMGVATLVAGTVTVSNTSVTASTRIFLTVQTAGGTQGFLSSARSAGTSFTINSSSASDTSTVAWLLVEPY